jgi:hypothetical protein
MVRPVLAEEELKRTPSKGWAEMIRKVYEVDPLVCPRCGGRMKVVAFLTEYAVADRIIRHLTLTFAAEKPPPAQAFEQVALMAAEESGDYEMPAFLQDARNRTAADAGSLVFSRTTEQWAQARLQAVVGENRTSFGAKAFPAERGIAQSIPVRRPFVNLEFMMRSGTLGDLGLTV